MKCFRLLICISVPLILYGCSSRPVVETVTTDAGRASALPAGARPFAREPDLPGRDPEMEAAGDRIAEAVTYLNSRRRDRREVALRALNQAEATLNHALKNGTHNETVTTAIHSILKDLDSAERAVQRSAPDAMRQLTAINKSVDETNRIAADKSQSPSP